MVSRSRLAAGFVLACASVPLVFTSPASARAIPVANCERVHAPPQRVDVPVYERAVRCLVNNLRRRGGEVPLRMRAPLRQVARRHSGVMREQRCFQHQCPGEARVRTRIVRSSYVSSSRDLRYYGQLIAWGDQRRPWSKMGPRRSRATAYGVVRKWNARRTTRSHILGAAYRDIGIGVAFSPGESWVTAIFARRG